jgi:hypothetical protein
MILIHQDVSERGFTVIVAGQHSGEFTSFVFILFKGEQKCLVASFGILVPD